MDDNRQSDYNRIFELIILAGRLLLENGAEIFRVEETMKIIAASYGIDSLDIFVLANGIMATMPVGNGENQMARTMHIPIAPVHLGRVSEVNRVSRKIVQGEYTTEEGIDELNRIAKIPYESNGLQILFAGIGSASFCYILGGTVYDSAVAFVSGFFLYIAMIFMQRAKTPEMLRIAFGGALVTVISITAFSMGFGTDLNHIMIGSIICLVPGVSFTTAVRNYFAGDYLSGTVRLVNALLVSISISVGVATVMLIWEMVR